MDIQQYEVVSGGEPVTVSVVLPLYNCPEYICEAVDSILHQSFQDFELIIIDDGSTDNSPEIIRGYQDPRIRRII
jgi:glycosyltransferase involved in cell wall biosynthesis